MKNETRQAQRSAATRTALIRVARRLFAERGYAGTATEDVVKRARVTRGALYHHFHDKRDLFAAVLDEEQKKLSAQAMAAASAQSDPWRAIIAGSNAVLDGSADPAVQRIVLIDGPAVLGAAEWRAADHNYFFGALKMLIEAAMAQGLIERQPVDPFAHIMFGALHEAAMLIAQSDDKEAARRSVGAAVERLFANLRGRPAE